MNWRLSRHVRLANPRINDRDAHRQQVTAAEICRRLNDQAGLILADEVGMGKTFVAFAVATSILHATSRRRPVVVMVPSAVSEKWPRDWSVFEQNCLTGGPAIRATATTVRRGSEFLKLLDDPPEQRVHIIFLTHGALSMSLNDPFIRLAIVRQAFRHRRELVQQRRAFPRWAARLLNDRRFTSTRTRRLLDALPASWPSEWARLGGEPLADDPVPAAALRALDHVDLSDLRIALADIPLRTGLRIEHRLRVARRILSKTVDNVWKASLRHHGERLPLLVLDEAHHVKNTNSLARLFDSPDALRDAEAVSANGALANMFERMLFLTATPFQLGHRELISVIGRFSGADIPQIKKDELRANLITMTALLDSAQAASLRLERAWGRLTAGDLAGVPPDWWDRCPEESPEIVRTVAADVRDTRRALTDAGEAIRPWVVRHTKDKRRIYRPGQKIYSVDAPSAGLEVTGPAMMPFLLAARAQALFSLHGLREQRATPAYFAEGLASSFEAFAETRANRAEVDDLVQQPQGDLALDVQWYVDKIGASLPEAEPGSWSRHPKLQATTDEAVNLWRQGEKVLIFCFYRATGRALRSHISRALLADITGQGATMLRLDPGNQPQVLAALDQRADTLLRSDAPGSRVVNDEVRRICVGLPSDDVAQVADVLTRFMRTASFLVRFVDLRSRNGASAIEAAFQKADGSGVTLAQRIAEFARFIGGLTQVERDGLWEALRGVQTGSITTISSGFFDPGEAASREATLPNVRLANGRVQMSTRQRLMRTFNTPFFPEVLVASSVMAEGVDLHLDCRHVIHHDLDWNPSTLEQRTGRVDRVGSKSEQIGIPIVVYEPYMAGTQDEKMYKVVKYRERWFHVLMGEHFDDSEWSTDHIADRVPLPPDLLQALTIDLSVIGSDADSTDAVLISPTPAPPMPIDQT